MFNDYRNESKKVIDVFMSELSELLDAEANNFDFDTTMKLYGELQVFSSHVEGALQALEILEKHLEKQQPDSTHWETLR